MYSTPPANTEELKERISYKVILLKENPDLVNRVMNLWQQWEQGLYYAGQEMAAMWRESEYSKELRLNIFYIKYILMMLYKIYVKDVIKDYCVIMFSFSW